VLNDYESAIGMFRKAIEAGFRDVRYLRDLLEDHDGLATLFGTPEYEEVRLMVDKLVEPS
jgi:hypothetical protein